MITKGKTKIEKNLLKKWSFIDKIIWDGILQGYRLYTKGYFNLPHFYRYYWFD